MCNVRNHACTAHICIYMLYMHVRTSTCTHMCVMFAAGVVTGDSDPSEGTGEGFAVPGPGQASTESPHSAPSQERHLSQGL